MLPTAVHTVEEHVACGSCPAVIRSLLVLKIRWRLGDARWRSASDFSPVMARCSWMSGVPSRVESAVPAPDWLCLGHKKDWDPTYPAGDDDAGDNRDEGDIGHPGLPLHGHEIREHRGEEGRGRPHCLIERNRQVLERDVAANHRAAEDEAERGDLQELQPRSHGLHRHHPQPGYGHVAEQRARRHVAHGEEDRVLESIVAKEVLVEQKHPNIGGVPRRHQRKREQPPAHRRRRPVALSAHPPPPPPSLLQPSYQDLLQTNRGQFQRIHGN
ncbi:hypothetical protein B296_00027044 [Ensete ventricosum]|uniref:Uncharacterized protein n=1 Tax=Ensete ventricosum TaxID=4639 RepID=A0A426YUN5_ENSVE|nr:hypothetical protein B296_00027044 [Ensete ventricosum]